VRAYHGVLQGKGLKPHRALEDDLKLTDQAMSYDASAHQRSTVTVRNNPTVGANPPIENQKSKIENDVSWPKLPDSKPDFAKMTSKQRRAYDMNRLTRLFG